MYSSLTIFFSPGHCPGWTVIGNSVCVCACLSTPVAWPTNKYDTKYMMAKVLYLVHLNADPKETQKKGRQPAHQLCWVFL